MRICCTVYMLVTELAVRDVKAVVARLAIIEAYQRQHTLLMQHMLSALQKSDVDESCDVPEGISLPLNSLRSLEAAFEDKLKAKQLVHTVSYYAHACTFHTIQLILFPITVL